MAWVCLVVDLDVGRRVHLEMLCKSRRSDVRKFDSARRRLCLDRPQVGQSTGHAHQLLADVDLPAQEVDRAELQSGDLTATQAAARCKVNDRRIARLDALGQHMYLIRRRYDVRTSLHPRELYARARRDADRPIKNGRVEERRQGAERDR